MIFETICLESMWDRVSNLSVISIVRLVEPLLINWKFPSVVWNQSNDINWSWGKSEDRYSFILFRIPYEEIKKVSMGW